ncbi:hypothetical protein [Plasticicumulans sp.]|uniref:hypothetical protein n=1 Tax=Plasticicumulans sp. TaxID=2307179 RepID=UPI003936788A|nr:hypothetical protein [Pseudomonadota bacterium]
MPVSPGFTTCTTGLVAFWLSVLPCTPALAEELALSLEPAQGPALVIGTVTLEADGDGERLTVAFDESRFEDHFLSMRPFRCLPAGEWLLCRLPYPYEHHRRIRDSDLVDLEYALLFVIKPRSEYGIDLKDGLYWRLARAGRGFVGTPYAVDYTPLGVPPAAGELRPLTHEQLWETEAQRLPFVRLRIGG